MEPLQARAVRLAQVKVVAAAEWVGGSLAAEQAGAADWGPAKLAGATARARRAQVRKGLVNRQAVLAARVEMVMRAAEVGVGTARRR